MAELLNADLLTSKTVWLCQEPQLACLQDRTGLTAVEWSDFLSFPQRVNKVFLLFYINYFHGGHHFPFLEMKKQKLSQMTCLGSHSQVD